MIRSEAVLGLPDYEITGCEEVSGEVRIRPRFTGRVGCPHCGSSQPRLKDRRMRRPRHESWGERRVRLELETRKWQCRDCGRSEASLESYLRGLEGKHLVELVCIDLAAGYRALARTHFPQARIVADRFHVVRTVNHHFLNCWKDLDPTGAKNRGLVCLMRRHSHNLKPEQRERLAEYLRARPAVEAIYDFKQRLTALLLEKSCNQKRCRKLARRFLVQIAALRCCGLAPLVTLGDTLFA